MFPHFILDTGPLKTNNVRPLKQKLPQRGKKERGSSLKPYVSMVFVASCGECNTPMSLFVSSLGAKKTQKTKPFYQPPGQATP